jgi:NADH:ubiquinone oxidoreductase subunit 3 (subunit A)
MNIILTPPIAFLIYIVLVLVIVWVGKVLAGPESPNPIKSSVYGSGEEAPTYQAAPGYRPFFLIAFFFAILHLGMLVLGSGGLNTTAIVYMVGLILCLVALILG